MIADPPYADPSRPREITANSLSASRTFFVIRDLRDKREGQGC